MKCAYLLGKFNACVDRETISSFRTYCTPRYTKDLWTNYRKTSLWKLHVAFIEALRLLLNKLRWISASEMFVTAGATTFKVLLTDLIDKSICRHMKQI